MLGQYLVPDRYPDIRPAAWRALSAHDWSGNEAELRRLAMLMARQSLHKQPALSHLLPRGAQGYTAAKRVNKGFKSVYAGSSASAAYSRALWPRVAAHQSTAPAGADPGRRRSGCHETPCPSSWSLPAAEAASGLRGSRCCGPRALDAEGIGGRDYDRISRAVIQPGEDDRGTVGG